MPASRSTPNGAPSAGVCTMSRRCRSFSAVRWARLGWKISTSSPSIPEPALSPPSRGSGRRAFASRSTSSTTITTLASMPTTPNSTESHLIRSA
jgi:hypothetical protein